MLYIYIYIYIYISSAKKLNTNDLVQLILDLFLVNIPMERARYLDLDICYCGYSQGNNDNAGRTIY